MKYTPVLAAAAVGFVDGEIAQIDSLQKHKYIHALWRGGALLAGAAGEMYFGWPSNINYGVMTGASALIGVRVPYAVRDRSIKSLAYTAAPALIATEQPHTAAGCTTCAAQRAAALAMPGASLVSTGKVAHGYRATEQPTTGAG